MGGGTATDGTDYTIWTFSPAPRIAPGETSTTFTLTFTVNPDNEDEGNETVILSGTSPGAAVSDAVVTIGQPESITLSVSPDTIAENTDATEVTVTATMSAARAADTVVNLTLGGSAADPADYTATNLTSITIPKGETTADGTLTITPVNDTAVEGDETITVSGASGARAVSSADITITDTTVTKVIIAATGISVSGPTTAMERGVAIYTISLSPKGAVPQANLTVDYATSDGSDPYLGPAAVAGSDYTAKSGTLTFTPTDAGPKTVIVPILDDTETDSGELFTFSLSNLQGGGTRPPSMGRDKVTTVILDANKDITLTANRYTIGEHEIAARITLTATRTGTEGAVTITSDFPLGGTATPGALGDAQDYVVWSRWAITIPDGASSASTRQALGFTMTDDDFEEEDETIIVNGRATGGLMVAPVVLTIRDNDRHDITLTANRYTIRENEIAARVTLTATRSGTTGEVTITGVLPPEGTATPGALGDPQDYVTWTGWKIVIPDGASSASTRQALGFTMTDDSEVEGDETLILNATATGGLSVAPVVLTIRDNDRDGITLSASPSSLGEDDSATSVTVTATLQGGARSSATVVTIGALSGTATKDSDYTATSLATITIPANATSGTGTFTVTPVSDYLAELDETIWVEGTTTVGLTVSRAVITITDEYTNNIALSVSQSSIAENAGATQVTVTATRQTARDVETVVKLSLAGTAKVQDDYTAPLPVTITIPANQTTGTATLTVTPVHDALDESDEIIRLYGTTICHTVSTTDIILANAAPKAPVISFETAPTSVVEGSDAVYVVKLEGSRTTNVTVRFKTGSVRDLATAGQDYTAVDTTLTFLPTDSTKTVTVSTLADTRFEVTEDFTVTLSDAQGGGGLAPEILKGSRTTTIADDFTDDDAYPDSYTLTATPTTVGEGDGATQITFTATLDGGGTFPAPVDVVVYVEGEAGSKGTAALNEDYTVAGNHGQFLVFSIPANSASGTGTLTLTPVDDSVIEGEETAVFTSETGGGMTTSDRPSVTLADNDMATSITLSVSPSVLREGSSDTASDVTVTATLDGGATLPDPIEVAVSLEDGTADSEDYSKATVKVTIPAGESSGSANLKVTVKGDDKSEPNETLNVTGTAAPFTVHPAQITILDDDSGRRGIVLTVSPNRVREDAGATVLSVTASLVGMDALSADATLNLSLADGTATLAGGDYSAATGTLTIPANQLYGVATFTFTPTNDAVVESDETVRLTAAGLGRTQIFPATITIINSSHADLSISGPSAAVAEGSTATFTVTLSAAIAENVSVAWLARPNTAVAADYSPASGSVTFPAGSAAGATRTFTVQMTDDALSETLENFTVGLGTVTSPVSAFVAPKSGSFIADAYIAESDPITVSITGPSTVDEGDETTVYTASLSPAGVIPTADLTVDYATSDGTAAEGDDYDAASGTLTFTQTAAGPQTFTVPTTEDTLDETDETFTVSLDDPTGGGGPAPSKHATDYTVTTTITDDDAATGITLSADPDTLEEDQETAETVTVTATLSGGTRTEATVVTIGTLAGSATKDTDYTVTTALASITIPANTASATGTITITPVDDKVVEGNETIIIPGTTTVSGLTVTSATITMKDLNGATDDPNDEDKADLYISGPSGSVSEGSDASFTVTLSTEVASEVKVAWSASFGADASSSDIGSTSGTVTFAANSAAGATQTITIAINDDMLSEKDEAFTVTLGAITTSLPITQVTLKSDDASATATIAESDPITVNISGPSNVDEGDETTAYTVSLSPSGVTPTADLEVSYATADGTATAGSDYTAVSGRLTFTQTAAGPQTFTVQTTDDTTDEGTGETFTVTISGPSGGGATPALGTSTVTTTITDDDATPTGITLSASPNTLGEDDAATAVTVTATMNGSTLPTQTVVTIGTLSGSATKGTDYTATSLATITIPANSTSGTGTLTVTPTDDSVVEGDETISIPGTTTVSGLSVTSATITLTDDDKSTTTTPDDKDSAELSITGPTANVAEGADASFTVTLSAGVASEVQVAWSTPLGTDSAEGADLGTTSGTVTFAAGSAAGATQTITIRATDDALSETAESFTVTLGAITSTLSSQISLKNGASSAQATIAQSDPITISITGPSAVDEGDATGNYTVSLSPSGVTPTSDLTVSYATSNGTATAGSDYTAKSGTLTFSRTAAGSQTFTVQTTEDTLDEGAGETFTVTISSPSGGGGPAPTLGTSSSVTTTITDDDDAPTGITLSANPNSLGEDDAATSVTVTATLNGGSTRTSATVVTIGALAGTATKDTDYTVTSLATITIPANSTSGTGALTITPTDDQIVEGDETIVVPGTTTTQVGLTVTSATITLTDDDKSTTTPGDKDSAELSITGPTANVAEGADASFTVTLSAGVASEVQVAWSTPLGTDSAEGADLGTTSGTVTFAAGSAAGATQTITIRTTDDALSETAESFTVTLGAITSTLSSQISLKNGAKAATATISESDPITINISGPSTVDEGDATGSYTVSLSPSGVTPTSDLTVSYATSNGTATAGSDYTAKSGTLTFTNAAPGAQTFTVQTTEDTLDEGAGETFTVTISSPSGGGGPSPILATAKSVTTTITDDDDAPTGITLSANPNSLGEDDAATSVTVTATLNGGSTRTSATVVTISALAGTATKDTDYTVTSLATITIPANSTSGTGALTVTPTDDQIVEGDETIVIPGTTTVGLSVSDATITLTDDDKSTTTPTDDKDSAELSISGPAANVAEGSDATFTVTLSKAVAKAVTVAWSAPLGTDAAGSADLGTTSGTVTFAAGSAAGATQTITIRATDDALSETAESFTVTLGAITSTLSSQISLKNGASSAQATIAQSDPITISITGPSAVDEGDATGSYTVSLSPSGVTPTSDLTVSYATSDGTATAGTDYTAKSGTLTFTNAAAGAKTFTVQTTEDSIDEGTGETFTVTISSPSGGGGPSPSLATTKSVTTTITDDDDAPTGITLSANPNSLGEDDAATSVTVTATLNGGSTRTSATVVTIGTLAGSATKDTDYTATALASITIAANATSGTGMLTITPTDDAVVEGDETITIPGTTTVGLTVTSATITLTDDDKSTTTTGDKDSAELSIAGPTSNVSEGSDATFTVTLSAAVSKEVTVTWTATGNTDDYSPTSGTVTFAAGSAAGATEDIDITTTDDALSETAESFTVTLETVGGDLSSQVTVKSSANSATATIAESDPITVSISGPSTVDEGDTTTAYTVSLSPSGVTPTSDLTVDYATSDGTATAGTDYAAKAGTLTFSRTAAGSQTFTVQTTEDTLDEGAGETFTVTISSPSGGGGTTSLGTATVTTTITDDDDAPTGITLSAIPNSLGEDDSATSVTVTATLNGGSTRTSDTVVTIGTFVGTATKDTDYTVTSLATVTISANSSTGTGTFTVTPTDDDVVEGDETISIPGTTIVSGLSVTAATVTLTDDDKSTTTTPDDKDSAELSITGPTANVAEGSDASFTVTLSAAVAKAGDGGVERPAGDRRGRERRTWGRPRAR